MLAKGEPKLEKDALMSKQKSGNEDKPSKAAGFVFGKDGLVRKKKKNSKTRKYQKKVRYGGENDFYLDDLVKLELSNKARKCLSRGKIYSIEKLRETTDEELLSIPATGLGTVAELRKALYQYEANQEFEISDSTQEESIQRIDSGLIEEVLDLSVRARNCLSHLMTIGELRKLSEADLLGIRGMGVGTVKEILSKLNDHIGAITVAALRGPRSHCQANQEPDKSDNTEKENIQLKDSDLIEEVLNLSIRARNRLSHLNTIGELRKFSEADLLGIRGMGVGTVKEILSKLNDHLGTALRTSDDDSLDNLNLSYKASRFVQLKGIKTITELEELSDQEVLMVRGMGKKTLREIRDKTVEYLIQSLLRAGPPQEKGTEGYGKEFCTVARRIIESQIRVVNPSPKLLGLWRAIILEKNYTDLSIRHICFEAGAKWPGMKSVYSEMSVGELLDCSWNELLQLKAFGKNKAEAFFRVLAFLASGCWAESKNKDPEEEMKRIITIFPGLKKIEAKVLEYRIGKDAKPKTLEEIATINKITRERVRQIQKSALSKLRSERNLAAIDKFLTANEKKIWYLLGGVKGIISENDKFEDLADQLPYKIRFSIQVFTGSKVTGERFPHALRTFLNNRYKFVNGCWYNVPIDPDEIEMLLFMLKGEFSAAQSMVLKKALIEKFSRFGEEKIEYALSMTEEIHSYHGYCSKQKFTSAKKREVKLHVILAHLSKGRSPVYFDKIFAYYQKLNPFERSSYSTLRHTLENCPTFFCRFSMHQWISAGRAEDFEHIYTAAENIEMQNLTINYRKELTSQPRVIYDYLRREGVSKKAEILNETRAAGTALNTISLGFYLEDHDCFLMFAPLLWGIRAKQSKKRFIEESRKKALDRTNYKAFILSKYAEFDTRQFPLWDSIFEKELLLWAENGDESDHETLSLLLKEKIIKRGREEGDKARNSNQPLSFKPPSLKEKDFKFPNSADLMSALLWLRENESISWIQSNYLAGRSLTSKKGVGVIFSLRLLGLIEPTGNCFQLHLANPSVENLVRELLQGKEKNWSDLLSERIAPISKEDPLKQFGRVYFYPKFIRKKKRISHEKKKLNPNERTELIFRKRSLENRLQQLRSLIEKTGKFEVSRRSASYLGLRSWMDQQRVKKRKGMLSQEVEKSLDELGFEWEVESSPYAASRERLEQLKAFKEKNGNFEVPRKSPDYPGLRQWVDQQRSKKRHGKLSTEIEKVLDELGVEWEVKVSPYAASRERLKQLKEFKEKNGNLEVPRDSSEYPGLRQWMDQQRSKKRHGKLSSTLKDELSELGLR